MREAVTTGLLLIGATFMLLAAVGIVRLPDVFTRMQATAKAATFGISFTFLAVAVYFGAFGVTARVVLIIAFVFLTVPISAHMIGRAAYFVGVPLWEETVADELRGYYALPSRRQRSSLLDHGGSPETEADQRRAPVK